MTTPESPATIAFRQQAVQQCHLLREQQERRRGRPAQPVRQRGQIRVHLQDIRSSSPVQLTENLLATNDKRLNNMEKCLENVWKPPSDIQMLARDPERHIALLQIFELGS